MDTNLIKILKENEYDYNLIYSYKKTIKDVSNGDFDINLIVGVKGMTETVRVTLKNIVLAKNNSNPQYRDKIRITLVEQDNHPLNREFCKELNVDYIFIPQELCKTENMHSTAIMYNTGFLFGANAKYYIFHCADILLPKCYFNHIFDHYLIKKPKWLQCFTKKRVKALMPEITEMYIRGEIYEFPEDFPNRFYLPELNPGAPGGSLLVEKDTFIGVGGYDAELFYGYTNEDSFFWLKLECLLGIVNEVDYCHVGYGLYADNPPIEIYHLQTYIEPPPNIKRNPKFLEQLEYFKVFSNKMNYSNKMKYIKYKSKLFNKYVNKFSK